MFLVSVRLSACGSKRPKSSALPLLEVQGHLAKGQRLLAGDGMSHVTKNLLDLTQRGNFYAGDLLCSVEILRNVTDTFRRASYEPSSDDVQVHCFSLRGLAEGEELRPTVGPG